MFVRFSFSRLKQMKSKIILPIGLVLLLGVGWFYWESREEKEEVVDLGGVLEEKGLKMGGGETERRWAVLTDSKVLWQKRAGILREMNTRTLRSEDVDFLFGLLRHQPRMGAEEGWWVVANEIMEQLRRRGLGKDRYADELTEILMDSELDPVMRDYAAQHLGQWLTPRGKELGYPCEVDEDVIKESIHVLGSVISDESLAFTSIPGTVLRVFADMKAGGFDENKIDQILTKLEPWISGVIEGKVEVSLQTCCSAIQAVGSFGLSEHLEAIRALAGNQSGSSDVRLNSVAVLGVVGSEADVSLLESLLDHPQFQYAATTALKSLRQHHQLPN